MQRNVWWPSVDEVASGFSPRKIRLATGSLRRSFFTLGRLLALASRQQSMALQPGRAGRRVSTGQGHYHRPALRSGMATPRERLTPRRLGQPRMRGCAWDKVHPRGGSSLPAQPASALRAVAGEEQERVPRSEGLPGRKRCCCGGAAREAARTAPTGVAPGASRAQRDLS